jgi:plastocyanin
MVSQGILIGIVVGVFFAGLGIGYAALQSTTTTSPMMMNSQQMQQMMDDPQQRNQLMNTMMDDPQMRQQMMTHMMNNPDMMNMMMNNPDMMNMMMENNIMMGGNMMMGRHMMGTDMMSQGMMSSQSSQTIPKSEDPQTRTFQISMEEVEFYAEAKNEEGEEGISFVELHRWEPNIIIVNQGDTVILEISNPRKHAHTLTIPAFNVNSELLEPREGMDTITFVADTPGVFTFYCGLPYNPDMLYCDPDHSMMTGTLIVLE